MIAFMKYNLFPYVVWGEVIPNTSTGNYINVKGYGCFSENSVEIILQQDTGLQVAESVRQIDIDYQDAKAALHKEYIDKLKAVIPWKEFK